MGHGGSGSTDGGGGWKIIRVVKKLPIPNWLQILQPVSGTLATVGNKIKQYGSFRAAVVAIVAGWVVQNVLNVGTIIIESVLLAVRPLLNAIGLTEAAIIRPLQMTGRTIFGAFRSVNAAIADVTGVAGPAAPVITLGLTTLVLYLGYRLAVSLLGEVPVIGAITDFLGVP